MTIEFRCTSCDKLLRTPADTEGKQAKCPDCGMLMTIPATSAFSPPPREPDFRASEPEPSSQPSASRPREPAFSSAPDQAAPRDSGNPFQSPGHQSMQPQSEPVRGGFRPSLFTVNDTFAATWEVFTGHWWQCVAGTFLAHLCGAAVLFAAAILFGVLMAMASPGISGDAKEGIQTLVIFTSMFLLASFFLVGILKFLLRIARDGEANFADLFAGGDLWLPATAVFALLMLGFIAGSILLIVPGIVFMCYFGLAPLMLVDQRTSIIDSFKYSAKAMHGNGWALFLLSFGTNIAGQILVGITCGVGWLFVTPFYWLLYVVAYLCATGQLTSVRRRTSVPAIERASFASGMTPPPTFE